MVTDPEILVEEIAPDLLAFLKEGRIERRGLSTFFREGGYLPSISALEKILRIHFVLSERIQEGSDGEEYPGVIPFARILAERLHRVKTTVEARDEEYEGEVRGRIDWHKTFRARCRPGSRNPCYVCERIEREYGTPENLVLREIVSIISDILENDMREALEKEYGWVSAWVGEANLGRVVPSLLSGNVYMRRIPAGEARVTERMVSRALKARLPLYRDAARLLLFYRRLMAHEWDPGTARWLLYETFIRPGRDEALFELFWVVRIIRHYRERGARIVFYPLEEGESCVARWTAGEKTFRIFHNAAGNYALWEGIEEARAALRNPDSFPGRKIRALEAFCEATGGSPAAIWSGRPDILLEVRDGETGEQRVLVGEVKYTDDPAYAGEGLVQLLEYMALLKGARGYLEPLEYLFSGRGAVFGILFSDAVPVFPVRDGPSFWTVRYGEFEKLGKVLDEFA
ncbi:MAG: hypothetical protein QFX32_09060 [Methanolinea sp.]|nr:hypothetical protein [Methanolinea sp.]